METIGRIDKADFPELKLRNISIKVDTGAYTSSIHCHHVKEIDLNGEKYIEFELLDPSQAKYIDKVFKVKNYQEKSIKSSFGNTEQRFIITTIIVIFGQEHPIELSLSERSDMKYPILLGRKFLSHRFVVDTSLKNVSIKLKREKKKNI
ncbi:RimK/LysX family protein [Lentimicrobium sp. S6]|uniref:ATP-dependent zinc protease family protein n=1 Tax=Lentimicrobium sp. S6 TaxID=2735872 RepID=UPI0015561142|nr:RimK/LysX family protein [Lentimicrobium sp. S6]NPD46972.1 peptidase [Lentimicrobium sp. S6]